MVSVLPLFWHEFLGLGDTDGFVWTTFVIPQLGLRSVSGAGANEHTELRPFMLFCPECMLGCSSLSWHLSLGSLQALIQVTTKKLHRTCSLVDLTNAFLHVLQSVPGSLYQGGLTLACEMPQRWFLHLSILLPHPSGLEVINLCWHILVILVLLCCYSPLRRPHLCMQLLVFLFLLIYVNNLFLCRDLHNG